MARFYQTEYITPRSAYVPLPLDAMAAKLQNMQQAQDAYRSGIEAFDKPFANLPIDEQVAMAAKQKVQSQLESLRNMDYNDAANRDQIYKTIKGVRDFYSPQGEAGMLQGKVDQYNANKKHIQDTYKDNPTQMGYLLKQLDNQFMTQDGQLDYENKALRQGSTGTWENASVNSPSEWTWVDMNKYYNDTLGTIAYDTYKSQNPSWTGTPADAVSMYFLEGADSLTKKKIDQGMFGAFASNPDVIRSAQAQSDYNSMGTNESMFYNTDGEGNMTGWNTGTLLGTMLENRGESSKFYREKTEHGTVTDRVKEEEGILKMKERNALVLSGEIPGATTSIDATKNAENITNITAQLQALPDTPQNKAQREQLQKQLEIAQAYQTQIMNAAAPTQGYQSSVDAQWAEIQEYRTDPSSRSGFYNDPFMQMMNTKEGNEKIKTKEDYDKWLRGEITLGGSASSVAGGVKGTQSADIFSEDEVRGMRRDMTLANVKELEDGTLNVTNANTVLWGDKESGVGKVNGALTDFVKNTPTNFIAQDGSSFQQWQADHAEAIKDAGEGVEMRVSVTTGPMGDVYYASYVDANGNPIAGTTISPVNDNTATMVRNTVGNKMVDVYSGGTTEESKKYTRMGQEMIATSGSDAGASADEKLLTNTADAIPDPPKGGYEEKVVGQTTVMLNQGGQTTISYRVAKNTDNKGQTTTTYTPLAPDGTNLYSGQTVPGANSGGGFTNIKDMQIALAKDDLGIPQTEVLKQQLPQQPR